MSGWPSISLFHDNSTIWPFVEAIPPRLNPWANYCPKGSLIKAASLKWRKSASISSLSMFKLRACKLSPRHHHMYVSRLRSLSLPALASRTIHTSSHTLTLLQTKMSKSVVLLQVRRMSLAAARQLLKSNHASSSNSSKKQRIPKPQSKLLQRQSFAKIRFWNALGSQPISWNEQVSTVAKLDPACGKVR